MPDQSKYTSKLSSSNVLIIGGSSGIGFCVAEASLEHGAHICISSSNSERVQRAVSLLQERYPSYKANVHGLTVDLSDAEKLEGELKGLCDGAVEKFGGQKMDHVVFTAGDGLAMIPLRDMNIRNIIQAGTVRFFAPLLLAKFLPDYVNNSYKSSYIITTGAVSEKPIADWSVIGSYAGGHHSMVRGLALSLKPIRVNGVSPGAVDTELWRMSEEEKERMMNSLAEKMATGRAGRPEDVAESYLGLMKDWNIDGSMISTNGGSLIM